MSGGARSDVSPGSNDTPLDATLDLPEAAHLNPDEHYHDHRFPGASTPSTHSGNGVPEPEVRELPPAPASRLSLDYLVASVILLAMTCYMVREGYRVSNEHHGMLKSYLKPPMSFAKSWSLGHDLSDFQWRVVLQNLPLLGVAMIGMAVGARLIRWTCAGVPVGRRASHTTHAEPFLKVYYIAFGLVFIWYFHSFRSCFLMFFLLCNFFIAKLAEHAPYPLYMACVWSFHLSALFLNWAFRGYRFGSLFGARWAVLDAENREILGWHIVYNMSVLRMIAYCYDRWEAVASFTPSGDPWEPVVRPLHEFRTALAVRHRDSCLECAQQQARVSPSGLHNEAPDSSTAPSCYKYRVDFPHEPEDYGFFSYMSYCLYVPLFIAGPMSSYNAFISHLKRPQRSYPPLKLFLYAAKIVFVLYPVMVVFLHTVHLSAFRKRPEFMGVLTLTQKACMFYLALAFLWLKFSLIWKFFRLIALIDGIEPPEDMRRCFSNTVTIQSFWRDWHSSFNQWIVRYMYIPMGGAKYRAFTIFIIFGFIGIWHDMSLELVWWALVMCAAFVPEILVQSYVNKHPRFRAWKTNVVLWRRLRAFGGACSIWGLVVANLVGFGMGSSTTMRGVASVFGIEQITLTGLIFLFFLCAAIIGVRSRDAEAYERQLEIRKLGLVNPNTRLP